MFNFLSNLAKCDQVIAIVNGEPVKISGVWSGVPVKRQNAEKVLKKYSDLFQELHNGTIEETAFVDQLASMKPPTTNLLDLFNALQYFSGWKAAREIVGQKPPISLQPVQDQETINTIKDVITAVNMSLEVSIATPMSSDTLPLVADVTAGEENSDVFLAGARGPDDLD
ncbi:MAG: hypothetical protein LBH67_00530 [Rickettsia sp.]|jgi:hypothetical protein|nr:hypothetical protein [Rickettsia sp.]